MKRTFERALLWSCVLLAGCAAPRHYNEGQRLLEQGQPDQALVELRAALKLEPNNAQYRLAVRKEETRLAQGLLLLGEEQQKAGQFDAALASYQRALSIDPQNEGARRAMAALVSTLAARKLTAEGERLLGARKPDEALDKVKAALAENAQYAPALALRKRIEAMREDEDRAQQARAAAQSIMRKPITLQLRDANLRMVFESMSRVVGLNVILDRDVKTDLKTTIFVKDATVEDTVDLILLQNQLQKRVINGNTLFIYPATPAKDKEYQELKVKVFDLSNLDAKYIQTLLKSLLKIKDIVIDEKSNTVVIRDTPEAIAVAESLVAAQDVPEPEVMLEVEVLEVSRDRLSNLGVKWPDGFSLNTPGGSGANGALTWGELRSLGIKQLLVQPTPLSIGFNANLTDSDANLLASPRIRVRNKEKARVLIGDRVPFVSGSNAIATGGSPIVTNSVQYLDVGIKLEVEPNIYAENDVGIKINMEVSSIAKEIQNKNSGDILYQIGTRSTSTSLRLNDGETQVLAGLLNDQERNSAAKVPGLGQIPLVGHLFSSDSGDASKTEIVMSITPHIIRGRPAAPAAGSDFWSGTDSHLSNVPLRMKGGGTMQSITSDSGTRSNLPGARPPSQPIPGAVIPGVRQPEPQPAAAAPAQPAEGNAQQPATVTAPPVAAPTPSPQDTAPAIFSPPPPSYAPTPQPQPAPGAPGAGIRVQPFQQQ